MSIDDQVLIRTPHDYRDVFKTYLQGVDTDIKFVEKSHFITTEDARWQLSASPVNGKWAINHHEPVVGFRPTMSMSANLRKGEAGSMQLKLVYAFFPLIQQLNCDIAYVESYFQVALRYKDGQLQIKTQHSFWNEDNLKNIPVPYVILPDLPNF